MTDSGKSHSAEESRDAFRDYSFLDIPLHPLGPAFEPVLPDPYWLNTILEAHENQGREWQRRFLEAAMNPIRRKKNVQKRWQEQLDKQSATHSNSVYSERNVNMRFVVLFQTVLYVHNDGLANQRNELDGGEGGAQGWTPDQRLGEIERCLRYNKRTVMDVIEGVRVEAFVRAPESHSQKLMKRDG